MLFIPPIYAVYTMVAFGVAGGVSRLVGRWLSSDLRSVKERLVFDVEGELTEEVERVLRDPGTWKGWKGGVVVVK